MQSSFMIGETESSTRSWRDLGREAVCGIAEMIALALMMMGAGFLGVRLAENAAQSVADLRPLILAAPAVAGLVLAGTVAIVFGAYRNSPSKGLQLPAELRAPAA